HPGTGVLFRMCWRLQWRLTLKRYPQYQSHTCRNIYIHRYPSVHSFLSCSHSGGGVGLWSCILHKRSCSSPTRQRRKKEPFSLSLEPLETVRKSWFWRSTFPARSEEHTS